MFGVSRIPVRESLKTLIGEGLVDHRPNLGYRVAQLTAAELREMYIVREVLETAALPIAVEQATDADRAHLIEINRQLEASLTEDDSREYHRLSREFHLSLTRPSRMHRLLHMLESAWNITEPVQPMVHVAGSDRASLHDDHADMIAAFLDRDSDALLRAAQHHHTRLNSVIRHCRTITDCLLIHPQKRRAEDISLTSRGRNTSPLAFPHSLVPFIARQSGASMTDTAHGPAQTGDLVEAAGHPVGGGLIKDSYDTRLTNEDLAPLKKQTWTSYNLFAFWMSDVHSVGGYVTAGSLFALGLASWQVLISLLVGITIVYFFCNLVAKPSQVSGVPYPVICRSVFGVLGANIPAIIRGLIAVAWYGIQTFLASAALDIVLIKLFPSLAPYAVTADYGFAGLSLLGWASFLFLWVVQAAVFWRGMESIRKFIDFCGPAVYVVMFILCGYLIWKAGWGAIDLNLGEVEHTGLSSIPVMLGAIALVVSYFSGPMLNFGDFSRYGKSYSAVKKGNFLGLPVNFLVFSILVVVTASLTLPVFGELITDPVETVARIDSTFAIVLGALTFTIATIGINIVANFISPAFDFSNVSPQRISWRAGGMIAAIGSVLITPWNLYNNPDVIHLTLETLGAFIGPLFGILIADYYLVRKQKVVVDELFSMSTTGLYWYSKGYNPAAVYSTIVGALVAMFTVLFNGAIDGMQIAGMSTASKYSWFIGCGIGFAMYFYLATRTKLAVTNFDTPVKA